MSVKAARLTQVPRLSTVSVDNPSAHAPAAHTILIVDDTTTNLGVIAQSLAHHGFRVMVAEDGEEGIQRAEFAQPDLILLDVMMPGISGIEVCRRLKSHGRTRHIPVIFMTALSDTEDKLAGFEAGGVDYLTKPLQIAEVVARVNTHLRIHLLQQQLEAQNLELQQYKERLEHDVAERTSALAESNQRLHVSEQHYQDIFNNISDAVFLLEIDAADADVRFRLLDVNPVFEKIISLPRDACVGKYLDEILSAQVAAQVLPHCRRCLDTGAPVAYTIVCELSDHARRELSATVIPVRDGKGKIYRLTGVVHDVTAARRYETLLHEREQEFRRLVTEIDLYRRTAHQQANFDALTGLPNRNLLSEHLQKAVDERAQEGRCFSLMMLDLDNFKEINDTIGHTAGDLLLREMASRLQGAVRDCDMVARLGGDEFALLLPDAEGNDDRLIAGRILQVLAEPFLLDGQEFVVTASIGIARYPSDSSETDNLYKYADSAMYHAKTLGRNTFHFYAPELTRHVSERLETEAALRRARKNGELELYYQPQVDMPTGRVVGAEALLRWNRPGHGLVTPDRFIPVAEASGLIVDVGEWVLRTACEAAVEWNRGRNTPLSVAVNLSTRQFIRNDLAGSVYRILNETGCRPNWLKLEITESLLLDDSEAVVTMLQTLNRLGLSLSIDDFGTGYSSLSYLNRFPVSQLKIDRSFVRNISVRRDKSELVKAMLSISAALRLETVAEGVESQVQADYLMAYGCRLAQGYLYGKPMSRAAFESILPA